MRLTKMFFALILLFGSTASAQRVPLDELPEFSNRFYFTVIFSAKPTAQDIALAKLIDDSPELSVLASQTNFHAWSANTRYIRDSKRWQRFLNGRYPAILFQSPAKPDGTADTIFFQGGDDLRPVPDLIRQIFQAIDTYVSERLGQRLTLNRDPACPVEEPPLEVRQWEPQRGNPYGQVCPQEQPERTSPSQPPSEVDPMEQLKPLIPTLPDGLKIEINPQKADPEEAEPNPHVKPDEADGDAERESVISTALRVVLLLAFLAAIAIFAYHETGD